RIETRLLVHHDDGEWMGYSYRWSDDAQDATLLDDGDTRDLGGQTWHFPSRSQCLECHTLAAGRSLGLDIRQLDHAPSAPNAPENAIDRMVARGWLSARPPSAPPSFPSPSDLGAPLDGRARAYLHANCAHCHRPGGGPPTTFDFRFETPFATSNLCNHEPTQ